VRQVIGDSRSCRYRGPRRGPVLRSAADTAGDSAAGDLLMVVGRERAPPSPLRAVPGPTDRNAPRGHPSAFGPMCDTQQP
jgi:hypothetical protein